MNTLLDNNSIMGHNVSLAITRACSCACPNSTLISSSSTNDRKTPQRVLKVAAFTPFK